MCSYNNLSKLKSDSLQSNKYPSNTKQIIQNLIQNIFNKKFRTLRYLFILYLLIFDT